MLAEESEAFVVTVPIARGSVAHKAIELGIHWRGRAGHRSSWSTKPWPG